MKKLLAAGVVFLCATALAKAGVQQDLEKMRSECDKALNAAAKPIYARYQAALDQMLRRATQTGDAEGVALINAEIERASLQTQTKESLVALITGSRWEWFDSAEPAGKTESWLEFYKDGTALTSWGNTVHWGVVAPSTLHIVEEAPPLSWTLVVNAGKKVATADKAAGGELRSARYLRNAPILNPAKK